MARSLVSMIAGVHPQHNTSYPMIGDLQVRTFTILDEMAEHAPEIRAQVPDAVICVRMRQINPVDWSAHDPRGEANHGADIARKFLRPTDFVTPANEMNLPDETGGRQATYEEIADWSGRFADEWHRLGSPCGIVSPALSPGHSEDQNDWGPPGAPVIGFQILQEAWSKYDAIGAHCYWLAVGDASLYDVDGLARFYAFRDSVTCRRFWPDKPVWIGEWNTGGWVGDAVKAALYARDCDFYLRHVAATQPWVIAATHFVLDSFNQPYQIAREPNVLAAFRAIGHEQDAGQPAPPIDPPIPPVEPPVSNDEIARIAAKYNITIRDGAAVYVAELIERPDPANISAFETSDIPLRVATKDDRNVVTGTGQVDMPFNHDAAYYPTQGQSGYFYATGGDARVDGLGWAFGIPGDTASHRNVVVRFARRSAQPAPPAQPPPASGGGGETTKRINGFDVSFGFLAAYEADPVGLGLPISPMVSSGQFNGEPNVPAGQQRQMQYFERATLYWTGSEVKRL